MGSKGSQKTTQAYTPAAATGAAGNQALTMAQTAANQPFQQPVALVAGFTGDQYSAFENMRNLQGAAQPYMNRAGELFNQSANPISGQQVGNYLNPYANYVMSGMENLFGQQRKDQTGRLVQAAGGQGADRIALAQGNLAREQGQAAGQTLSGIYGSALGAAQQDASRQQAAGFGFGQLGPAIQNAMMNGTQGLFNFGGIQQQQQQAQLNAPYQNELAKIAYPFQTAQFLGQQTAQTAPALGGTTTNTYPAQSPWGTIAGLGMTGLGAFMGNPAMMGSGLKGVMGGTSPQTMGMMSGGYGNGGWNPNVGGGYVYPSARGGAVPYKYGGAVDLEDIGGSYQEGGDVGNTSLEFDPNWDQFNQNRFGVFGPPMPQAIGPEPPNPQAGPMPQMPPQPPGPMMPGPPNAAPMPMPPNSSPPGVDRSQLPPQFFAAEDPGVDSAPGMPPNAMGMAAAPTRAARPPMPPPAAIPPVRTSGEDFNNNPFLPPDPNEGSWSRGPGAALMAAGLATMAAAGKRDSRGLPMGPFAAIGEGGAKGLETLKEQDTAVQQRLRVDQEARKLLNQAEHQRAQLSETARGHDIVDATRRDAIAARVENDKRLEQHRRDALELQRQTQERLDRQESEMAQHRQRQIEIQEAQERRQADLHPLTVQQRLIQNKQAEHAFRVLEAGDIAINDPKVLEAVGLTEAQAALLTPSGVRQVLVDLAKSRYDVKEINGEPWLVDRVHAENSRPFNQGEAPDRYGLSNVSPARPSPPVAPRPGQVPNQTVAPPANAPAPTPVPAQPGTPQPAGTPRPSLGSASSPASNGTPLNYGGAYGPASVLTWLGLKATDVTSGTASDRTFNDTVARNNLQGLRDRIISSLSHGRPEARLKMVQERINNLLPQPGKFFTGPQEGLAAFKSIMTDIDNDINMHKRIIDPRSTGYDKKAKSDAGRTLLELNNVRNQVVDVMKYMSMPNEIRNNPGLRVTPSGAIIIPDPKKPGGWLQWQP